MKFYSLNFKKIKKYLNAHSDIEENKPFKPSCLINLFKKKKKGESVITFLNFILSLTGSVKIILIRDIKNIKT